KLIRIVKAFSLLVIFCSCSHACALEAKRVNNTDLVWKGESDEVRVSFISGGESTNGMYLYRVKFPKGHKIVPHFHSDERIVSIVKGSLYVGYGDTFDEKAMKKLQAGGLWTEPKAKPHYVWAKDGEVELQV